MRLRRCKTEPSWLLAAVGLLPLLAGCGGDPDVVAYGFSLRDANATDQALELVVTHNCELPTLQVHLGESGVSVNLLLTGTLTQCGEGPAREAIVTVDLSSELGSRPVFDLSCDLGNIATRCDRRDP
jgi:hypothetical protein